MARRRPAGRRFASHRHHLCRRRQWRFLFRHI
uniref:Uncharacterized protein n=1 Tax=Arundo donax TaxID=35708 RepID=A0A0A9C3J1_ARUDO